ncbi:hypothetical protein PENTCL1PPCAC_27912, partial [Pristionchus entomophagus]
MLFRLLSLPALFYSLAAAADAAAVGIPSLNGNLGLTGAGYGDAYGGKVSDGVYGVGGRAGGQLGLTGLLGLGSGRRKRQASAFASAQASGNGAIANAQPQLHPQEGRRD